MGLIILQAEPLIEWDDTITRVADQSLDCQDWLADNVFSETPIVTTETVSRPSGRSDLTRPIKKVYLSGALELTQNFTYPSVESYAGMEEESFLIES
jgi:hypothetical protein